MAHEEYDLWMAQETPTETLRGLVQACPSDWLEMKRGRLTSRPFLVALAVIVAF